MRLPLLLASIAALVYCGQAVTYKNVGRSTVAETVLESTVSSIFHPFVKHGFVAQSSGDATTNYFMNIVRPFYKVGEQAGVGFIQGFLGADIKNPVYCVTDGLSSLISTINMINKIFSEE